MVDVTAFYDFRQVGSAQSTQLFPRVFSDRRPLIQDLPIQVDELDRLVAFVLRIKELNPSVETDDFFEEDSELNKLLLTEVEKCNEAGYSRVISDGREPDIQSGYVLVSVLRGFIKPKKEIDAYIAAQERNRKDAERLGPQPAGATAVVNIPGATRTVVNARPGKPGEKRPAIEAPRKRTPPQRNVLPQLITQAGPIRPRSPRLPTMPAFEPFPPSPKRGNSSRSPPPPPFGGGASDRDSLVSVGNESSLTRLLASLGEYDSMSDLFTVDVGNLRKAFPAALRTRDTQVVVAEMYFGAKGPCVEPEVQIEE